MTVLLWIAASLPVITSLAIFGVAVWHAKPEPPAPPPGSLQGRADALRALGEEVDAVVMEFPAPHRRKGGGWVA